MNGLGDELELIAMATTFLKYFRDAGLTREEQDRAAGIVLAHGDREFDTIHPRHEHVCEHPVRLEAGGLVERIEPVVRSNGIEAGIAENLGEGVGDEALIVY